MTPPICPVCKETPLAPEQLSSNICAACASHTGLWRPAPDLRPPGPCRACGHTQLVRALLRDRAATGGDHSSDFLAPTGITFAVDEARTFWTGRREVTAKQNQPIGILVVYACRRCGYTELYTSGVAEIPIGPEYGTTLIDVGPVASAGPFR